MKLLSWLQDHGQFFVYQNERGRELRGRNQMGECKEPYRGKMRQRRVIQINKGNEIKEGFNRTFGNRGIKVT